MIDLLEEDIREWAIGAEIKAGVVQHVWEKRILEFRRTHKGYISCLNVWTGQNITAWEYAAEIGPLHLN